MSRRLIVLVALVGISGWGVWGQTSSASISGRITDPSGAPIVGARIRATNVDTNVNREVASAESGSYTIPLLPVGAYSIEVEAHGFKAVQRKGVILQIATNQELN